MHFYPNHFRVGPARPKGKQLVDRIASTREIAGIFDEVVSSRLGTNFSGAYLGSEKKREPETESQMRSKWDRDAAI